MSDTGKQSPLGDNVLGSILNDRGLTINPIAASFMGASKVNDSYTPGKLVRDTCLYWLTYAINNGWLKYQDGLLYEAVYNNLINIGAGTIRALGNSKPDTYIIFDPSNQWAGEATTGYAITGNVGQGQEATWIPYNTSNPNESVTQWGYIRLHALQAWNEFNWNGQPVTRAHPEYKEFTASFMTGASFVNYSNQAIFALQNSKTFLKGTYSNQDDLITADVAGVNLSTKIFGEDLVALGKAIDLSIISTFGLPSSLLRTLRKYNAISQDLSLALLAAELSIDDVEQISTGINISPTVEQEQKIYGAFLVIVGQSLIDVLVPLNCKTKGLTSLADLLDIKKLFPKSYPSMTVPIYNAAPGPTNSKTYYLIYKDGGVNSQILTKNFGLYLNNILPPHIAQATGAFSVTMQQIRNIEFTQIEKFAKSVYSMELTTGLDQVNGTDVPVDVPTVQSGLDKVAIGSGVYGTFTMSDILGCMSGLPYPWRDLYGNILSLQTAKLIKIYQNLYLAIQWEQATASVNYTSYQVEVSPGSFQTYYNITGVTLTNPGGGYIREDAPPPTITINGGSGATASLSVGTNVYDIGTGGGGTYGRVTSVGLTSSGTDTTTIPTATIQAPPGPGWPGMNAIIQAYIDDANAEIASIFGAANKQTIQITNVEWNLLGTQLTIEQRARFIAMPPVPIVNGGKDRFMNPYPLTLYAFVDSVPELSQDTRPHMTSQTLTHITDFSKVGGDSLEGQQRQERNQRRLLECGINLDNNVPDVLNTGLKKLLVMNGTVVGGTAGVDTDFGIFTIPAWPGTQTGTDTEVRPQPDAVYDGNIDKPVLKEGVDCKGNSISSILDATNLGPYNNCIGPVLPEDEQISLIVVNTCVPTGSGTPVDDNPVIPGSLAGSPDTTLPIELDSLYTSSTLLPASYSVEEAIDKVIECNCDCWID